MRKLRTALLAGAGILLAGGTALAASEHVHVMNVALPDGSVAQLRYHGDTPPRLMLVADRQPIDIMPMAVFYDTPFVEMDRIAAMMDAEIGAMMRQVAQLQHVIAASPGGMDMVSARDASTGVVQYSYVATTSGDGQCVQSIEWRSDGTGAAPKVIHASSGDCGGTGGGAHAAPSASAGPQAAPAISGALRT